MPEVTHKPDYDAGGEEDFASLFEQSLRSPKPGDVVTGRVVTVGPTTVTIDIGYKSEGHIAVQEFTTREGELTVNAGDVIDVYFEATDNESCEIALSRQKALQINDWR